MKVDVVLLPSELREEHRAGRAVAVFDVLRATTTIAAALAAGVKEIRIFGDLESASAAAKDHEGERILCGESKCLRPDGFDLGNSPGDFTSGECAGRVVFMCTTNGTRAMIAAQGAAEIYPAALVNVSAVAGVLADGGRDVTLLCAGTNGRIAMEDIVGAGAVIDSVSRRASAELETDAARMALRVFQAARKDLLAVLRDSSGGRNVIAAGLQQDINFAAGLDSVSVVGKVSSDPLMIQRI
jgi:2-phosphosulfolactate phosphatase